MMYSFMNTGSIPARKNSTWLLAAGIGAPVAVAVIALSVVMTHSTQASHVAPPAAAVSAPSPATAPATADAKTSEPMPGDGVDKSWKYGGAN